MLGTHGNPYRHRAWCHCILCAREKVYLPPSWPVTLLLFALLARSKMLQIKGKAISTAEEI
jgi:hypothetical protein